MVRALPWHAVQLIKPMIWFFINAAKLHSMA